MTLFDLKAVMRLVVGAVRVRDPNGGTLAPGTQDE
jgi:hypothetical protein